MKELNKSLLGCWKSPEPDLETWYNLGDCLSALKYISGFFGSYNTKDAVSLSPVLCALGEVRHRCIKAGPSPTKTRRED